MKSHSLYELNEYIRRVVALNLPEPMWVRCELVQLKISRGHYYLSLAQKGEEGADPIARADAILWAREYQRHKRKLGMILDQVLQEGVEMLIRIRINYHELYGLQMIVEDIDPSYTLGQLEMQRQQNIQSLQKAGLLDRNKSLKLGPVLQRLAILSSAKAAGYQDFIRQLAENELGYRFEQQLFQVAVQGGLMVKEMIRQLKTIENRQADFDAVIIIRGGGARLDLMAFDDLALSETIARFPLPVLSGIGHDIDETVLDLVSHKALKTPTAVADFVINRNMTFEAHLLDLAQQLKGLALQQLHHENYRLGQLSQSTALSATHLLRNADRMLDFIQEEVKRQLTYNLRQAQQKIEQLEYTSELLSPEATLRRGYSITYHNGKALRSTKYLKTGSTLETHLPDGRVESQVIKTTDHG